ncbi:hypothetical protein PPYR_03692 [Photinus pyralis]|uniref:LRRCT domain-containing protein n=4 Tax=Photinus pyralis TaxID=7054 RepID=A0A5N4A3L4_PHOPY|nr:insulin-like growth factor-binding protein complex acid labile subunit isoform X2 [Photinus pyralis]KAB0791892.1 hypothetical protein PPYR_03692 [Photinus pyralis]
MEDEPLTLEELQSFKELMEKVSSSSNKEQVTTMSIASSKFSFPPPGNVTLFENQFTNLENLRINNNQLEKLVCGAFYSLENLRYLEIANNSIEEIEEGSFSDLRSLFSLNISNNDIRSLQNGAFDGLDQLGVLILKNNGIGTVEREVFHHLRSLFNLELSHNKIAELSGFHFKDLENLGHLILKDNKMQQLPADIFSPLRRLRHLDVSRNKISVLPANLLYGFTMDVVNFSFNQLVDINESALKGLQMGSGVLDLSHNDLAILRRQTLRVSARKVVLSSNQIESIEPGAFEGCDCEKLYLNENALTEVNSDSMQGLVVRHRLCLSDNRIERLQAAFIRCPKVQRLDLDGNNLRDLAAGTFDGLKDLILLYLNGNALTRIEKDTLSGLPNLVGLYLQDNQIEELHERSLSALPSLISLILRSNKLANLPVEIFNTNPELGVLDLASNEFIELPPKALYAPLVDFTKVNFSNNKISKIPSGSFASETDSRALDEILLNANQIEEIEPGAFEGIKCVKRLGLASNSFKTIDGEAFKGLGSVYKLDLDENPLESVDCLAELPKTAIVSLRGGPLEGADLAGEGAGLRHIDAIAFESHSYRRDGDVWKLVDCRIEELGS